MNGSASGPATVWPPGIVVLLLAADLLFLVPAGIVTTWYGVAGNVAYWDDPERILVAGLGILGTTMFVGLGACILRYNVIGRPRMRIDDRGLWIGADRVSWAAIGGIAGASVCGVPCLVIAVDEATIRRLGLIDRTLTRLAPPAADGRRYLWITEQQLGTSVGAALLRVPLDRPDR